MVKTNTLISRIDEVKAAGASFKNSNILKDRKKEIENFCIPFNEVREKLNELEKIYISTKPYCNIPVELDPIRTMLIQLQEKVCNNDYEKNHVYKLKREIDKINSLIERSWKDYIAEQTSGIDAIISSLDKLIYDMPEKQILSENKVIFSTSFPGSDAARNAIQKYINTAHDLLSKLNLKDEVIEFIKILASQKNVTLRDLKPEVYNWMFENGFSDKIRLEFRK